MASHCAYGLPFSSFVFLMTYDLFLVFFRHDDSPQGTPKVVSYPIIVTPW